MRGTSLPFLGLALLLTVVWVVSPVLAQGPALPGPRTIVAGKSLAGIAIGTPIDAVVARFGTPSVVLETDRDSVYVWHRFGLNAYARDGLVTAISTSNSLLRAGEVGPGYRMDEAIKVFGPIYQRGTVEGFQGMQFDDLGIAFGIDRRSVAVIVVFTPGQASKVSGLQRSAKFAPASGPAATPTSPESTPPAHTPPMFPAAPVAQVLSGFSFLATQRAFSTTTNYMSLSGYLRWLVFQSSANWVTMSEASRMVKQQRTSAPVEEKNTVQQPQQPSTVQPSTVQPSTVQPSTVQPSTVQPSTVQQPEPNTIQEQPGNTVQQGE